MAAQGAELAFSYQGEALKNGSNPWPPALASRFSSNAMSPAKTALTRFSTGLKAEWGSLDFVVHAIGFSDKNELRGPLCRDQPRQLPVSMDISDYSFTAVCQRAAAMMGPGGSLLTLTYYGAEKVMPHYNVMGLCKAALEASVKYIAEDWARTASASTPFPPARSDAGRQRHRDFRYIMPGTS